MPGQNPRFRSVILAVDQLASEGIAGIYPIHGLSWCEVDDAGDFSAAADVVVQWPT